MEIVALVIVTIIVLAYYGVMDSVEKVADMAKRRVTQLEKNQMELLIKEDAQRNILEKDLKKAIENNNRIEEIKSLFE